MIKIVVMCGGRGSRLKPLTDLIPKPLVTLNGKPILHHVVTSYLNKNMTDFIVCVGYREDMIRDFFAQNDFTGHFAFSNAGEQASILQRLYEARTLMSERVFVAYGDTLINVDLEAMVNKHQATGAKITITTADVQSPFGLVTVNEAGWATSFKEKPSQMYYVGHMLLERAVLETVDPALLKLPDGQGLIKLFDQLIEQQTLQVNHYSGPQITFNTQQERDQAEKDFITFFTHKEQLF